MGLELDWVGFLFKGIIVFRRVCSRREIFLIYILSSLFWLLGGEWIVGGMGRSR